jgi:prepilin-type N-terminal cleavage/methylation domain-containing protein
MFRQEILKRRSGEEGFTLIELLVVIVILGILAAIVVFAIGGLSDSAQKTSCSADANTIQTAEDAYYASPTAAGDSANQVYVDMDALVTAKLLKKDSTLWTVSASDANGYTLHALNAKCGADIVYPTP